MDPVNSFNPNLNFLETTDFSMDSMVGDTLANARELAMFAKASATLAAGSGILDGSVAQAPTAVSTSSFGPSQTSGTNDDDAASPSNINSNDEYFLKNLGLSPKSDSASDLDVAVEIFAIDLSGFDTAGAANPSKSAASGATNPSMLTIADAGGTSNKLNGQAGLAPLRDFDHSRVFQRRPGGQLNPEEGEELIQLMVKVKALEDADNEALEKEKRKALGEAEMQVNLAGDSQQVGIQEVNTESGAVTHDNEDFDDILSDSSFTSLFEVGPRAKASASLKIDTGADEEMTSDTLASSSSAAALSTSADSSNSESIMDYLRNHDHGPQSTFEEVCAVILDKNYVDVLDESNAHLNSDVSNTLGLVNGDSLKNLAFNKLPQLLNYSESSNVDMEDFSAEDKHAFLQKHNLVNAFEKGKNIDVNRSPSVSQPVVEYSSSSTGNPKFLRSLQDLKDLENSGTLDDLENLENLKLLKDMENIGNLDDLGNLGEDYENKFLSSGNDNNQKQNSEMEGSSDNEGLCYKTANAIENPNSLNQSLLPGTTDADGMINTEMANLESADLSEKNISQPLICKNSEGKGPRRPLFGVNTSNSSSSDTSPTIDSNNSLTLSPFVVSSVDLSGLVLPEQKPSESTKIEPQQPVEDKKSSDTAKAVDPASKVSESSSAQAAPPRPRATRRPNNATRRLQSTTTSHVPQPSTQSPSSMHLRHFSNTAVAGPSTQPVLSTLQTQYATMIANHQAQQIAPQYYRPNGAPLNQIQDYSSRAGIPMNPSMDNQAHGYPAEQMVLINNNMGNFNSLSPHPVYNFAAPSQQTFASPALENNTLKRQRVPEAAESDASKRTRIDDEPQYNIAPMNHNHYQQPSIPLDASPVMYNGVGPIRALHNGPWDRNLVPVPHNVMQGMPHGNGISGMAGPSLHEDPWFGLSSASTPSNSSISVNNMGGGIPASSRVPLNHPQWGYDPLPPPPPHVVNSLMAFNNSPQGQYPANIPRTIPSNTSMNVPMNFRSYPTNASMMKPNGAPENNFIYSPYGNMNHSVSAPLPPNSGPSTQIPGSNPHSIAPPY